MSHLPVQRRIAHARRHAADRPGAHRQHDVAVMGHGADGVGDLAHGLDEHRLDLAGDAQVSEKHANFIVNLGRATATDIERLIEHVEDSVEARTNVRLIREVRIIGERQ
jgi:hypothetical protein